MTPTRGLAVAVCRSCDSSVWAPGTAAGRSASRIPPRLPYRRGQTAGMSDVVYMVRGSTRAVCQAALDRLCAALGARPTMLPQDGTGRGWVARAIPDTTKAPAGDGRGPSVSG